MAHLVVFTNPNCALCIDGDWEIICTLFWMPWTQVEAYILGVDGFALTFMMLSWRSLCNLMDILATILCKLCWPISKFKPCRDVYRCWNLMSCITTISSKFIHFYLSYWVWKQEVEYFMNLFIAWRVKVWILQLGLYLQQCLVENVFLIWLVGVLVWRKTYHLSRLY